MFGIGADRTDQHELLDAAQPGLLDHVQTHGQVGVEEPTRLTLIRADAADVSRQVNHDVGPGLIEHPRRRRRIR